jgi:hypothetical protein
MVMSTVRLLGGGVVEIGSIEMQMRDVLQFGEEFFS